MGKIKQAAVMLGYICGVGMVTVVLIAVAALPTILVVLLVLGLCGVI